MFFSRRRKFEKQFAKLCRELPAKEWSEQGSIYKRLIIDFPEFIPEINALKRCAGCIFYEAIMNDESMSIDGDVILSKLINDSISEKMAQWAFLTWRQVLNKDAQKILDLGGQVRTATLRDQYSHIEQLVGPAITRAIAARKREEEEEEKRIRIDEEKEKNAVRQWCILNPERANRIKEKAREEAKNGNTVVLGSWGVAPHDLDQHLVDELVHELVLEVIHKEEIN